MMKLIEKGRKTYLHNDDSSKDAIAIARAYLDVCEGTVSVCTYTRKGKRFILSQLFSLLN